MKIIYRIDTDDIIKIKTFQNLLDVDNIVIPQGDHIKVHVISDDGKVTTLK